MLSSMPNSGKTYGEPIDHQGQVGQSTILVVDDSITNLDVLSSLLLTAKYKVIRALSGTKAIDLAIKESPDLILLDIMMPVMDGFETCVQLKKHPETQDIPVIFMTAVTDTGHKLRGFESGAVDYITKPFEYREVLMRIQTHLTIAKQRQQITAQNVTLTQEITERRRAEEMLTLLLHAVSHDLRNPVTGWLMVLRNLLQEHGANYPENNSRNLASGSAVKESTIPLPASLLMRMIDGGARQLALIESLLESHANDQYGVNLQRQSCDLAEIVRLVIVDLQPIFDHEGTTLELNFAADLPPVWVDPKHLRRVYENLLINAVKHNPPHCCVILAADVLPRSMVISSLEGPTLKNSCDYLYCTVTDNGLGMAPEQAEMVFERYGQSISHRNTLNLGLGLYICRQIVEAHGGRIGVVTQPNQGTTFWFTIPLVANDHVDVT